MRLRFPWNPVLNNDEVFLSYDNHRKNMGDILSPIIARYLGSKKIRRISKRNCKKYEHYFMIGSILQRCTRHSVIWGSGLISKDATCKEKPKKVLAVRGPLTREKLIKQGIECPEIYGDPALLLPEIYPGTSQEKKYKLGIIPHFKDKNDPWLKEDLANHPEVCLIDIQNSDPLKVVDEMLTCQNIISSSLHGIIVADAYDIPSLWIEFEQPFEDGHFKFQDYFKSVSRDVQGPVKIGPIKNLEDILEKFDTYKIKIDLQILKDSFPF